MSVPDPDPPVLVLGPLLRHVDPVSATVWVETDRACEVEVLGRRARTFCVAGHHYAPVVVEGLAPGSTTPYEVRLDGARVWPEDGSEFPPSRIRTPGRSGSFRIAFGSGRYGRGRALEDSEGIPPDALNLYAGQVRALPEEQWPDALVFLGDQVYADKLTKETRNWLTSHRARRQRPHDAGPDDGPADEPADEGADFAEYTRLYVE